MTLLCVLVDLDSAPGLVGGVADVFEWAVGAFRAASDAQFAAVPDDLVGE
jgi:hypothetical protein